MESHQKYEIQPLAKTMQRKPTFDLNDSSSTNSQINTTQLQTRQKPNHLALPLKKPQFTSDQNKPIFEHLMFTQAQPVSMKRYPHVPCKFYQNGICQAGDSCPFSHDLVRNVNICKYFNKGYCKFGEKCCNVHIPLKSTQATTSNNVPTTDNTDRATDSVIENGEDYLPLELSELLTPLELDRKRRKQLTLYNTLPSTIKSRSASINSYSSSGRSNSSSSSSSSSSSDSVQNIFSPALSESPKNNNGYFDYHYHYSNLQDKPLDHIPPYTNKKPIVSKFIDNNNSHIHT